MRGAIHAETGMPARIAASIADDVLGLPVRPGITGYEFVDGEPVPVTPASFLRARLVVTLATRLLRHVEENGLPGTVLTDAGFVLGLEYDPERMRGPDVAYVRQEKIDAHRDCLAAGRLRAPDPGPGSPRR